MSIYKKVDFYELCRLCMCVDGKKHDLHKSQESHNRELLSKLKKCIPLSIKENDTLPQGICENCIEKIEAFYNFISECMNTESMLRNYCASSNVSDQLKCQEKVYVKEFIENNSNNKPISLKECVNFDSSILTMQNITNLVQFDSTQINNIIHDQYQLFCKYNITEPFIISAKNEIEFIKYNYTIDNNSNQSVQMDSIYEKNVAIENIQAIYSESNITSSAQNNNEINIDSLAYVTSLIVEPELPNFDLIDSECNNQDLDINNSKSEVSNDVETYMNDLLPINNAVVPCNKVLENKEEIVRRNQTCEIVNKYSIQNIPSTNASEIMLPQYSCEVCEKKFKKKEHLKQHKKLHAGERPHKCEMCPKSFVRKEHLIRHRLIHTGERLYNCDLCHKKFNRKYNLQKHQTTHRKLGPFICEICGKLYKLKHNYNMHNRMHNEVTNRQLMAN